MQPIGEAVALFHQALAVPGQLAQLALLAIGNEGASGRALDKLRIDLEDLKAIFQDVVDRLPLFASAFNRNVMEGIWHMLWIGCQLKAIQREWFEVSSSVT